MEINDDLLSAFSLLKNRIMKTTHTCDVAIVMEVNNNYVKCKLVNSPEVMITCYKIPSLPAQVDDKVIVIYTDKDTRTNLININNNLEPVFVDEDKTYHSLDYGIIISNLNYTPQSEGVKDVKVNGTSVVTEEIANVSVPTKLEDLSDDSTHRVVTDSQISNWNSKQSALTFDNTPTDGSNNPVKSDGIYDALQNKVDKEAGKVLSSNDFTDTLKNKLDGIESNAQVNVNADWNANSGDAQILNKPTIPDELADLQSDSTHRVVTDTQITTWNNKQDALSSQTAYTNKGTSTKVPQISTNALGQVTSISEINIDYPVTSVNGRTGAITGLAETTDIPIVNDAVLTIQKNGTQIAQFSANASSNIIANISVPVNVSELVNDSDYATKSFVNSSIATNTANFRGTYDIETDLGLTTSATEQQISDALNLAVTTKTNNDYVFVAYPTSHSLTDFDKFDRYKYDATNQEWNYEYTLNNSSFTAQQWSAINSGITATLVGKITTNETNISNHMNNTSNPHGVTKSQVGLGNVDNTSDLNKPISTATQTALNGKQDTIDSSHKLNSDLVDDTNQTNKFVSASEKSQITTNQTNITNILDGTTIDSFSDVESALSGKQDKITSTNKLDYSLIANTPTIPTSIEGLGGGKLTSPLKISGGDSATASKIILDNATAGQITNEGTQTLFGFTSNNTTTLTLGHSSYALAMRGSGTRPKYNSNDVALYSDIPTIPTVNDATLTIQQNGVQVQTFTANSSTNKTANILTYNPNLLINPNFAINQRGSSSYSGNNKYGVDCWINGGSATQTPQSDLRLKVDSSGTWSGVCQFLESYTFLKGQTITFTVWGTFPSSGVRIAIKSLTGTTQADLATADGTNANSYITVSYTVPSNASYTYLFVAIYNKAASATSYLKYAKLEIGNKYSNYAMPNPAEELLKCCRYYWVVNPGSAQWRRFAVGYSVSSTEARYIIPFPAPMRVEPYITLTGTLRDNASWSTLSKGGDTNATIYALHLQCTGSGMTAYRPSTICTGDAAGNIICDSSIYFS